MASDVRGGSRVKGARFNSTDAGTLEVSPEKPMECEGSIRQTNAGVAFGPLEISVYPDSTATVGGLEFLEVESFFGTLFGDGGQEGLFGSAALLAGASESEAVDMDRRQVLQAAGVGALALAGAGTAAASTTTATAELDTYEKAQFSAEINPEGLRIRVRDRVDGVLPTDVPYYTYIDGIDYSRFYAGTKSDYGDVLPGQFGTVTVGPEDAAGGLLTSIMADKTQVYEALDLSKATTEADPGERVVISQNDILVEHVQSAGPDATTVGINGVSIPHELEDDRSTLGYYRVHNGALIYRVGREAPSGQTASVALYADRGEEMLDDMQRSVQ